MANYLTPARSPVNSQKQKEIIVLTLSRQTMYRQQSTTTGSQRRGLASGLAQKGLALGILTALGIWAGGAAKVEATTVAYWRFDGEGATVPANGDWVQPTANRTILEVDPDLINPPAFIRGFDSSGNGNHLYTWNDDAGGHVYRPTFLNKTVANGTGPNNWQIQNFGATPSTFTWGQMSAPTLNIDAPTFTPAQWTIEATVKPTTVNNTFRTIVGRDGNNVFPTTPSNAPLYFQITNTNQFRINYTDVAGVNHIAVAPSTVLVNQTYHVAATSNGSTLSLYVDQSDGAGLVLAASVSLAGSANTALAYDTAGSTTAGDPNWSWTVGRGRFGTADLQSDNHTDRWLGFIDEVRISDVALAPAALLFAGQNAPRGPSLTIDRNTGVISLTNLQASQRVRQYQIDSANGALNVPQHLPIAGRLDSFGPGPTYFDADGVWTSFVGSTATHIEEEDGSFGDGGGLGVGGMQTVVLSGAGGWFKNPSEALTASVQIYDPVLGNVTFGVPVIFTGNGGQAFRRSDLNFDGVLTGADWVVFRGKNRVTIDPLWSDAQSYAEGDLNGDQFNNFADFKLFQTDYIAANGAAAFEALTAVPEPSALLLAGLAMLAPRWLRRRRSSPLATAVDEPCYSQRELSTGERVAVRNMQGTVRTFAAVALAVLLIGKAQAVDVTLNANDALGTSSFAAAGGWSNALPPSAGNNYIIGERRLRTPADAVDYTFAGDLLRVVPHTLTTDISNGGLMYKGVGATAVITIPNLELAGGYVHARSSSTDVFNLAGNINVTANSLIHAKQGPITISAAIGGSANLTIQQTDEPAVTTARFVNLSGVNTFTGNIDVVGKLALVTGGSLKFNIGANGVNNGITGTGIGNFDGAFNFDLTGASTAPGSIWNIATTATRTFGANFTIPGFTPLTNVIWVNGGYNFNETTGQLAVGVPTLLTLVVNKTTGAAALRNSSASPITIDYYEATSAALALNAANGAWSSLDDQNFDAGLASDFNNSGGVIDSADLAAWRAAFTAGNAGGDADLDGDTDGNDFLIWQRQVGKSPGEGDSWDQSGGSGDDFIGEFFLKNGTRVAPGQTIPIGSPFRTNVFAGGDGDLVFQFGVKGQNTLTGGIVEYVTTGPAAPVPEPTTLAGAALGIAAMLVRGRTRRRCA